MLASWPSSLLYFSHVVMKLRSPLLQLLREVHRPLLFISDFWSEIWYGSCLGIPTYFYLNFSSWCSLVLANILHSLNLNQRLVLSTCIPVSITGLSAWFTLSCTQCMHSVVVFRMSVLEAEHEFYCIILYSPGILGHLLTIIWFLYIFNWNFKKKRRRRSCGQNKVFHSVNWPWSIWTRKSCNIGSIEHDLLMFASRLNCRCASGMLLIGVRLSLVDSWIAVNLLCVNLCSFWLVHSFQLLFSFRSFVFQSMARKYTCTPGKSFAESLCLCLPPPWA